MLAVFGGGGWSPISSKSSGEPSEKGSSCTAVIPHFDEHVQAPHSLGFRKFERQSSICLLHFCCFSIIKMRLAQNLRSSKGRAGFQMSSFYSRMRSEGSRFTWGSGGEAVFAKSCVCDRNRRQPSATACVRAVRLSTVASASGVVQKACQIDCLSPQLYWCLQRRCLWEWSVAPQLYWRLQRRCLWEWSVSPQLYYVILVFAEEVSERVIYGAAVILVSAEEVSVWVICVATVILVSAEEVSVRVICVAAVILVSAEEVSVWAICFAAVILASDLWRRSYIGVCRGGVWESDLWRRSYIGVCRRGVSESDLCRRSYIGVCRGGVCESDLCPRRVSRKRVMSERATRVSSTSVFEECQPRVSDKSVKWEVSSKSVKQECRTKVSNKSVLQECQVRVS